MSRVAAAVGVAVIALSAVTLFGQAKPNFAGRWTLDRPVDSAAGGGGRGGGGGWGGPNQTITITQDEAMMTVAYPQGPNNVTVTFDLSGVETTNVVPSNFGPVEQTSKAVWQGDRLVITTGQQTRSVSIQGGKLLVETSTPGAAGAAAATSRATYTKAPEAGGRGGRGGRGSQ